MTVDHESFMRQALVQAQRAFDVDEVPVGALVVMHGKIIAKAYNQVQLLKDVTAHAEILAITSACEQLQEKYLTEATLYVTRTLLNVCRCIVLEQNRPYRIWRFRR